MMLKDLQNEDWRWPHFSRSELACRGSGECRMSPEFLGLLEKIRAEFGHPMPVSSGYRSPEYNMKVSDTGLTGPHTTGMAVDIVVAGKAAYDLVRIAMLNGMAGIGVSQRGGMRFIHLDMFDSPKRPTIWSY